MPVSCVPLDKVSDFRLACFPVLDYEKGRENDSIPPDRFTSTGSCAAAVRPRSEWNRLGREIYKSADVLKHISIAVRLLDRLGCREFFVQQSSVGGEWFRSFRKGSDSARELKMADLSPHVGDVKLEEWTGGFSFRDATPLLMRTFLDYSFLLGSCDVIAIAIKVPLKLVFNQHLEIIWTSPDRNLIVRIRRDLVEAGILEHPGRVI